MSEKTTEPRITRLEAENASLNAELAQLRRELIDTRLELAVYRRGSETAIYEAGEFDAGLFLSGDRGVEDVMRRVLQTLDTARQSRARVVQLVRSFREIRKTLRNVHRMRR